MRNIKLILQYDGARFNGFELQPGKRTIRGEIEKALFELFKTRIKIISASRTDAGVHACQQVISFNLINSIPVKKIIAALNSVLPKDIRALKAQAVKKSFNARYAAKSKEYEYLIYNGQILPPFLLKLAWQVKPKLNIAAMKKAAKILQGKHDFSSFCAARSDDKNFARKIHKFVIRHSSFVIWNNTGFKLISIRIVGNGFLYKMVRNMVGTLVELGLGRITVAEVRRILLAKDRRKAGRTAPAQGLCLVKINY